MRRRPRARSIVRYKTAEGPLPIVTGSRPAGPERCGVAGISLKHREQDHFLRERIDGDKRVSFLDLVIPTIPATIRLKATRRSPPVSAGWSRCLKRLRSCCPTPPTTDALRAFLREDLPCALVGCPVPFPGRAVAARQPCDPFPRPQNLAGFLGDLEANSLATLRMLSGRPAL